MNQSRHQVFVSSTYLDLKGARQEVFQALLELDCFPAGMETFPASNETQWQLIEGIIRQSDYYLVIVGARYGSTDESGLSYTEREYDLAVTLGKPVLGFLHSSPEDIAVKHAEVDPDRRERLKEFRKKVQQRHCKFWHSAESLGAVVSRSLIQERKRNPQIGWIRADRATDPRTLERLAKLSDENEELKAELKRSSSSPPPGSEALAQGDESFTYDARVRRYIKGGDASSTETFHRTWDELLSLLATLLLGGATREEVKQLLQRRTLESLKPALHDGMTDFSINDSTIDTVIMQLAGIGHVALIMEDGAAVRPVRWQLTSRGLQHYAEVVAIPSTKPDQ